MRTPILLREGSYILQVIDTKICTIGGNSKLAGVRYLKLTLSTNGTTSSCISMDVYPHLSSYRKVLETIGFANWYIDQWLIDCVSGYPRSTGLEMLTMDAVGKVFRAEVTVKEHRGSRRNKVII